MFTKYEIILIKKQILVIVHSFSVLIAIYAATCSIVIPPSVALNIISDCDVEKCIWWRNKTSFQLIADCRLQWSH